MNLAYVNNSRTLSQSKTAIKSVSTNSGLVNKSENSESSESQNSINQFSISEELNSPQKTYNESYQAGKQNLMQILEKIWSGTGAVPGSAPGASSLTTNALGQSASSINLADNPSNTKNSGSHKGSNGADIKLPASATIPNPSTLTSKTDSLVPNPNNVSLTEFEFEVTRLTNAARQARGLPLLEVKSNLIQTARESSFKMQAINNMVHGLTSGWSRENIAMGQRSPQEVVRAWLNSSGHYANIMSNSKYIGVGDTSAKGGSIYWTMQLS